MTDDRFQLLRLLEAILFASPEAMSEQQLAQRMPEGADLKGLLQELRDYYANRGVNLMQFEDRYAFRTATDLGPKFHIEREVQRKLSRAAIETLAIIAYHQPVTRAEIEEIRGVVISKGTLDTLLEVGWIKPKGRRQTPGRPVTWATTDEFLQHFGLESCEALPGIEELRAAGLLDQRASVSTLGVQSLPGGGAPAEDDEDGSEDGLDLAAETDASEDAPADDDYDSAVLARLEGQAESDEEEPEQQQHAEESVEDSAEDSAEDEMSIMPERAAAPQ